MQKGPLWWAATHRLHHRHADHPGDSHSPVQRGFWYAHVGWMFSRDILAVDYGGVKDLAKYPELVWLDRLWMVPGLAFAAACYLAFGWGGGRVLPAVGGRLPGDVRGQLGVPPVRFAAV